MLTKGAAVGMNCNRVSVQEFDHNQLSNIVLVLSTPSIRGWVNAEIWANGEVVDKCLYLIDGRETKNSIAKYLLLRFFSRVDSLRTLLQSNGVLYVRYLDKANRFHYYERLNY